MCEKFESIQNKIQFKYYDDNQQVQDSQFNQFIYKNFVCDYLMFKDDASLFKKICKLLKFDY